MLQTNKDGRGWGQDEEGKGDQTPGDGRRLDFSGGHTTGYAGIMLERCTPETDVLNQCHQNTRNKKTPNKNPENIKYV